MIRPKCSTNPKAGTGWDNRPFKIIRNISLKNICYSWLCLSLATALGRVGPAPQHGRAEPVGGADDMPLWVCVEDLPPPLIRRSEGGREDPPTPLPLATCIRWERWPWGHRSGRTGTASHHSSIQRVGPYLGNTVVPTLLVEGRCSWAWGHEDMRADPTPPSYATW